MAKGNEGKKRAARGRRGKRICDGPRWVIEDANEPTPGGLLRQEGEPEEAHRAMLLWGLMDEESRAVNPVAQTLDVSPALIRKWRDKWDWSHRLAGPQVCERCAATYGAAHGNLHGQHDLEVLGPRVKVFVGIPTREEAVPPSVVLRELAAAPIPTGAPVPAHLADMRERWLQLVKAGQSYIAKALKEGKVSVTLGDMVRLHQFQAMLEAEGDERRGVAEAAISWRVQQAMERGTGEFAVLLALEEDLAEMQAAVAALRVLDVVPEEPAKEPS